jgi:uncharacterized RDD family membrane protein YckC
MSSAQRDLQPFDEAPAEAEDAAPFALKEQVAQRLAAHRARRGGQRPAPASARAAESPSSSRSSRIAAAVAERYAQSPSYRSFLAAQAESAIREAEAAADVAALNARAVADAQYELLAELDQWTLTPPAASAPAPEARPAVAAATSDAPIAAPAEVAGKGLTVRLYEDVPLSPVEPVARANRPLILEALDEAEGDALDEEIDFRRSPVFEETIAAVEIPANLIEFPRQLVAARKARPRLAEGPLREDADQAPEAAQLRIFEVEAAQISTAPEVESTAPEWSSILLAAHPVSAPVETPEAQFRPELRPQTAPLNLRVMASVVDACIIVAAFFVFVAAFAVTLQKLSIAPVNAATGGHISGQLAAIGAAGVLFVFYLIYQVLFFTFSEATPGMRYARIGLCTFSDDNPTRAAMRQRIFAVLLSACPLGIGFLWALLDDDGLGWHDRISRMYQRGY